MHRNVIIALVVGIVIGAGSTAALSTASPALATAIAVERQGTIWSSAHAAIPHEREAREPAPTF